MSLGQWLEAAHKICAEHGVRLFDFGGGINLVPQISENPNLYLSRFVIGIYRENDHVINMKCITIEKLDDQHILERLRQGCKEFQNEHPDNNVPKAT